MTAFKTQALLFFVLLSFKVFSQEKMVEVAGTRYNTFTRGFENRKPGEPAVIFESGMGVGLDNWEKVIQKISLFAPVFAYDRSGIGKSGTHYQLPTPKNVAENLHQVLQTLIIAPPYILVGHSLGGVYIRGFAGYYPKEIAGLVFIDPADFTESKNDWNEIYRKIGVPEKKIDEMMYDRLYSQKPKIDSSRFGPSSERLVLNELRKTDFADLSKLPIPHVPIYFFVGGKFEVPVAQRSKDFDHELFFHVKNNSNMERWKKLIYASPKGGALIYLTNAGHYIHWNDPKSVVGNIRILWEGLRE